MFWIWGVELIPTVINFKSFLQVCCLFWAHLIDVQSFLVGARIWQFFPFHSLHHFDASMFTFPFSVLVRQCTSFYILCNQINRHFFFFASVGCFVLYDKSFSLLSAYLCTIPVLYVQNLFCILSVKP